MRTISHGLGREAFLAAMRRDAESMTDAGIDERLADAIASDRVVDRVAEDVEAAEEPERWDGMA